MLELTLFRNDKAKVLQGLKKRNWNEDQLKVVDEILLLDQQRRQLQSDIDDNRAKYKRLSQQIGEMMKQGQRSEADSLKEEVATLKGQIKNWEEAIKTVEAQLEELLLSVPNIPHPSVPAGTGAEDNEIYKPWNGSLPKPGGRALPHWELAEHYKIIDLELGVKLTGSGFPVYLGKGARLERALINFFLDQAIQAGYQEVYPPLLVNQDTARATGQLPDKEGQMYHVEKDDLYLIPTAEVPVTNLYRDQIVDEAQLPIKLTAYTPCFRREAGSYGTHVRGLNRVHQFDKVEIVQIAHPDTSYQQLDEMLAHVSSLLDKLELPYRIVKLCGGDLGFTAAMTYDFEVWSAAQEKWLEVSSVSNFETYQSNRLKVRFKDSDSNQMRLAHTLNGSALALARIVAALLENNQMENGIAIPAVLHPYTGFEMID